MISSLLGAISSWVLEVISALGYFGISGLMFLSAASIPIPSEVIMPFSGFAASEGRFVIYAVILSGIIGGFLGSLFSFFLGRKMGPGSLDLIGKISLHGKKDFLKTERWFLSHGSLVVLVGLSLPIVRSFISLSAGIFGIKPKMFAVFSLISISCWSAGLALLGFALGENWESIGIYFRKFDFLIVALFAVFFAVWMVRHIKNKKHSFL